MKTLTEFSQLTLKRGAAAIQTASTNGIEGDALAEALQSSLGIAAEKAPRLVEALELIKSDLDQVRLVRVYQGETAPHGAHSKGEFHYVVDRVPKAAGKAPSARSNDRDGGRGGDRKPKDKPRGLGSLKAPGAPREEGGARERVSFGDIPKAGLGWQWTRAPREEGDFRGKGPRPPRRKGPGDRPGGGPRRPSGGPGTSGR